jgi:hypothetical protein
MPNGDSDKICNKDCDKVCKDIKLIYNNTLIPLSNLISGFCTLYHNFYCIFSCYLSLTKPGLRCLCSYSYTDMVCPVTEVSSF